MSDCRVQKKASASLSLRLPRGRPPAVGIDNSFFNLTPPSAESVTPTKDEAPVVSEYAETSVTVKAKEAVPEKSDEPVTADTNNAVSDNEKLAANTTEVSANNNKNIEDRLAGEHVIPVDLEDDQPIVTTEESKVQLSNGDQVDRFVRAQPPDINPNPHSTPAATEPEQRLEP